MRDRQVRDAGLEIIFEVGERARQDVGVIGADAGRQLARTAREGLIAGCDPGLEFRPWIRRDLGREIAQDPVREATLARRSGEAFLDRPDDPGRPVADHEQRIPEPSDAQVLEERPHGL